MITPNRAGRGSRRMICQATMLIGSILRAGETANDSVVPCQPMPCARLGTSGTMRVP